MTKRATDNKHSWLWASHIRTKQSKWLEQNLQDMEDKVENVLNLINKNGDSFAKRAEMYYRHRPEVISFIEETVRGYRSLAERYDKLSTELQKANTTIASICPEKVTYSDDDDYTAGPSKLPKQPSRKATKIPKAPTPPPKGFLNNTSNTTIKSCEETLEKLTQDVKLEQQRSEEVQLKLESLKRKFNLEQVNNEEENNGELDDTIDKLVNKMIILETSITSQTKLTDALTKQNDDLQKQIQEFEAEKASLMNMKIADNLESKTGKSDEVRWVQMLLNGLDDKQDILLEEYISILKSYKDTKKKLSEEEKRNQGTLSMMKSAIVKRDNTIQLLIQKLKLIQGSLSEDKVDIPLIDFDELQTVFVSASEEKLRMDIDALLNQNLDLWITLSNMFSQMHKFKTQVKDLQDEVKKVKATDELSDIKLIYAHLKKMNTKLASWLKQSVSLKDELEMINSRVTNIHEEITSQAAKFSTHEAARFKSEILNMKQENNKFGEELEAGLDHAIALKHELEQTLERLEMELGLKTNQYPPLKGRSSRRSLKSLLLGDKSKKQKLSFFSCLGHQTKTGSI